jgi:hypothetical protein
VGDIGLVGKQLQRRLLIDAAIKFEDWMMSAKSKTVNDTSHYHRSIISRYGKARTFPKTVRVSHSEFIAAA